MTLNIPPNDDEAAAIFVEVGFDGAVLHPPVSLRFCLESEIVVDCGNFSEAKRKYKSSTKGYFKKIFFFIFQKEKVF